MKYVVHIAHMQRLRVAPCAGAWIEIAMLCPTVAVQPSPPARGRGLKYGAVPFDYARCVVAPCAGAWIEMV